jgi:hypothetical protein
MLIAYIRSGDKHVAWGNLRRLVTLLTFDRHDPTTSQFLIVG